MSAVQQQADDWNAQYPIRTPVALINEAGIVTNTTTKSMAMVFAKSEAVVYISGMSGFINLNRLTVI